MRKKELPKLKEICSPCASGGKGYNFESYVQSSFVVLLLTGGVFPSLGLDKITRIELQSRYRDVQTDDITVYSENPNTKRQRKLLGQIKLSITFSQGNKNFQEVIKAAWTDFNNKDIFTQEEDIICLIIPSLSTSNRNSLIPLLEHARTAENEKDFYTRINKEKATSKQTRNLLNIFEAQLKDSNNEQPLSEEQVWLFLKHFHVFAYDLDIKGVTLSLLYSLLEYYSENNSEKVWCLIKDFVQRKNEYAGAITRDSIPDDITRYFKATNSLKEIPEKYIPPDVQSVPLNQHKYTHEICLAFLLGSWDENRAGDREIISQFVGTDYEQWISKLREMLQETNCPFAFKNGVWGVKDRKALFEQIKTAVFDNDIDGFQNIATAILKELDPALELERNQRYCANILGKVHKYSYYLRHGIANSLALISNSDTELNNCSRNKVKNTVIWTIRDVFKPPSWQLWAGLSDFLPLLAEAAPHEFLSAIDNEKQETFITLFEQEGSDLLTSQYYMIGVIRALEILAWKEDLLGEATLALAYLASIDPGGQYANRPQNSLQEIFTTWYMQTKAPIERQKAAIKAILNEYPQVAHTLLINILPDAHQFATGTAKPMYIDSIPQNWAQKITVKDHAKLVSYYADLLVETAKGTPQNYIKIVRQLPKLSDSAFDKAVEYMTADRQLFTDEKDVIDLWNDLKKLVNRHKRFCDKDWAMSSIKTSKLDSVIKLYEPKSLLDINARFFSNRIADEFYNETTDDDNNFFERIKKQQIVALKQILEENSSFDNLLVFINKVESSYDAGEALGNLSEYSYDKDILPKLILEEDKQINRFVSAYIANKFILGGKWDWVTALNIENWKDEEIAKLYEYIVPCDGYFDNLQKLAPNVQKIYWKSIQFNPYAIKQDINFVIEQLIHNKRKAQAIKCLYYKYNYLKMTQEIDYKQITELLLLETPQEAEFLDIHQVLPLIKLLQESKETDRESLVLIEWKYLKGLDEENGYKPMALNRELAESPQFFCDLIKLTYKSDNDDEPKKELSDSQKEIVMHALEIFTKWKRPPGVTSDNKFDEKLFDEWISKVIRITTESGHLDVALRKIGKVLRYAPADESGFWLNKHIAKFLNKKENEAAREGLYFEIVNSRGVHWVDVEAKPEKQLALDYKEKADITENEGYIRVSRMLREVSSSYEEEARRIIERSARETDEN